jgi:spore cortex biosynthesis protein YabQ
MGINVLEQLNSFFVFFISGIIIGVLFDIFRIIRKLFKVSDIHTYIEDILFGIITGIFLVFIIFVYNNGNVRLYMFIAMAIGIVLYLLLISKYFIKLNVIIFSFINKCLVKLIKVIIYPIKLIFKLLKKIFKKPYTIIIINIKKIKELLIYKKWKKSQKMLHKKKDFTI